MIRWVFVLRDGSHVDARGRTVTEAFDALMLTPTAPRAVDVVRIFPEEAPRG